MTLDERNEVYKQLEEQKGRKHQIAVAIEEMSELTKELSKFLREDSYTNNKKICEELADVKVVTEQLERFFDPDNRLVSFVMDYKLERLKMFYLEPGLSEAERKEAFNEGLNEGIDKTIIIWNDNEYDANKMNKQGINNMLSRGGYYKDKIYPFIPDKHTIVFRDITFDNSTKEYIWEVMVDNNSSNLYFKNEHEIINKNLFSHIFFRDAKIVLPDMNENDWCEFVNKALSKIEIIN